MIFNFKIRFWFGVLSAAVIGAACSPLQTERLAVLQISVGDARATVEVAATPRTRERGLMYRAKLEPNAGMLFVYPSARRLAFWMKNTLIPLDIGYFDGDGFLIEVLRMKPQPGEGDDRLKTYTASEPAKYALEMNEQWFERKNLRRYAKLKLPRNIVAVED